MRIDILLSTYNGERYIRELLESVFSQSFTDWCLIIRDDGSKDGTVNIINEYHQKYPRQIILMPSQESNLGAKASFGKLLEFSSAPYVMFCDQDDVWLKEKIQLSINKIFDLEEKFGKNKPLLVYTDSFITDKDLKIISGSAQHSVGFDNPKAIEFRNLILRNVVVGNTVIINRNLVKLSSPIPENAFMHDWWVAIIACACGHIGYVSTPTIYYRQHNHNALGLAKLNYLKILSNFYKEFKKYYRHQDGVMKQIRVFYQRLDSFPENNDAQQRVLIASPLAHLEKLGYWKRKVFLFSFYKDCIYRDKILADLIFYFKIYV